MLAPMAVVAPSQPVHNNSLYQVFTQLAANLPKQPAEGEVWLMVYDFKTLTQQPDMNVSNFPVGLGTKTLWKTRVSIKRSFTTSRSFQEIYHEMLISKSKSKIHLHAACPRMEEHDLSSIPRFS